MCGIVGFVTNETLVGVTNRQNFIKQGLVVDTLRGYDGTGVLSVAHTKTKGNHPISDWLKHGVDGATFVQTDHYTNFVDDMESRKFFVGHNRWSTIGASTTDNSHPFTERKVTLVHNGTLTSGGGLPKTQKELGLEVDSHAICKNISMISHNIDDVKELLEGLLGSYALVWHDQRDDSLNLVRSSDRPLYLAQEQRQETVYFCSEAEMLNLIVVRNHIKIQDIVTPKAGLWLKFIGGDILNPICTTLAPKRYKAYNTNMYSTGSFKSNRRYKPYGYKPYHSSKVIKDADVCDEMLGILSMNTEDKLTFVPLMKTPLEGTNRDHFRVVTGQLSDNNLPAIIYKVPTVVAGQTFCNRWLVSPVGVKYVLDDSGSKTPLIICEVVFYSPSNDYPEDPDAYYDSYQYTR